MTHSVNPQERAFDLVSGHRALDFLATLRDRHREPQECLHDPRDLERWLELARLSVEVRATDADLEAARALRETVDRVVRAVLHDLRPAAADVRELNRWAARPPLASQIGPGLGRRRVGGVEAALALVAQEAVDLVTGPERGLIRECAAAPDCSRVYLDRSRGRRRRWCRMEWCGSRAKMRAYRRRRGKPSAQGG
jgi:predicted RNA-binding Zn ribbon-like protein